jgi:hypothetical protein
MHRSLGAEGVDPVFSDDGTGTRSVVESEVVMIGSPVGEGPEAASRLGTQGLYDFLVSEAVKKDEVAVDDGRIAESLPDLLLP